MNASESTEDPLESRSKALYNWAAQGSDAEKAVIAFEKVVCVTIQPMPDTYNVMLKGRQENLSRPEALKLYRELLSALIGYLQTPCEVIKEAVSQAFRVSVTAINSPSRQEHIVLARHVFVWLAEALGINRREIAESISKDLTTVVYSIREMKAELKTNTKLRERVEHIETRIRELLPK